MSSKIVVGPFNKGFRNDVPPFYIDNDSFPILVNAYQWRNRVKRKRGTTPICRLQRYFNSAILSYGTKTLFNLTGNTGNLLAGFDLNIPAPNAGIVPGTVQFTDTTTGLIYTDPLEDGNLYNVIANITGATQANPSVLSAINSFPSSGSVSISGVVGMTQLNGNTYTIISDNATSITINVNSTAFTPYVSGGTAAFINTASNPAVALGTINYATGQITIAGASGDTIASASFNYYPDLPVMDIEDLNLIATQFPQTVALDTKYAYQIVTASPYYAYDVSFYKNPTVPTPALGYVPKTNPTAVFWNGKNYQQFWSVNYEDALWATNGITQPFTTTNIGMQFKVISAMVINSATSANGPSIVTFTIPTGHGLVVGDFVFINEVSYTAPNPNNSVNLQTGYVIAITATTIQVEFPNAYLTGTYASGGIVQYLSSNAASPTLDCIRWYDGAPTSGTQFNPTFIQGKGWVNFCPPIYDGVPTQGIVEDLSPSIYYLVGARMIIPFKDRLLFLGPVIQSTGSILGTVAGTYYLQDTIIYSQNGTPYYTASFTGSVTSGATQFYPLLTPANQSAASNAYFTNVTGYGGYITAGVAQPITLVGPNQDVLIVEFTNKSTKVVYSGNDLIPFSFYEINSEFGTTATFSGIVMDRGLISIGDRGFKITEQQSASRIDLEIPDYVFQFDLLNNGTQRITAQRDFVNEWVYFSFPYNSEENNSTPFPNQTLFYNYRDNSWAIFNESYTAYGPFRRQTGFTWQTVGSYFSSWNAWNQPWSSSSSSLLNPEVIAGNQQGFVVARSGATTSEAPSLYISAINTTTRVITSPNHGLNTGDFVYFLNALGMTKFNSSVSGPASITGATNSNPCVLTANNNFIVGNSITISGISGMTQLNKNTYVITAVTSTTITIDVDSSSFSTYIFGGIAAPYIIWQISVVDGNKFTISSDKNFNSITPTGTYLGNGTITRLYVPQIQSKQFPTAWGIGRKTRIGVQQYLFSTTTNAQITLQIYLSQNAATPFNAPPYVPDPNAPNDSVMYSNILYTCQESTNSGLTPANVNLQQLVPSQAQTWHRMNTSLIGDTVQVEFTLSEDQMFDNTLTNQISEIELHGMIIDVSPSAILS